MRRQTGVKIAGYTKSKEIKLWLRLCIVGAQTIAPMLEEFGAVFSEANRLSVELGAAFTATKKLAMSP
jgi:hypothetical protein